MLDGLVDAHLTKEPNTKNPDSFSPIDREERTLR